MQTATTAPPDDPQLYRTLYAGCPICGKTSVTALRTADCRSYPNWHPPLPETLVWLECNACSHVFTDSFYTRAGLDELFRLTHPSQVAGNDLDRQRMIWAPVVASVLNVLSGNDLPVRASSFDNAPLTWVDVGCGSGGLVFTASEFGFAATGIDLREQPVLRIRSLGYEARQTDLLSVHSDTPIDVLSMADLLEHTAYPVALLKKAHQLLRPQGVLYISCPNRDSASWRQMDLNNANPYWAEIEHHHNFSRKSLMWLLSKCGFMPVNYGVSNRYIACMEIFAVRVPLPPSAASSGI